MPFGELRKELGKPYVVKRLKNGYAYVICVADDLTPEKVCRWREWLSDEAQKQVGRRMEVQGLGSTDLATWASLYPAVVLRSELRRAEGFCPIETWFQGPTSRRKAQLACPN